MKEHEHDTERHADHGTVVGREEIVTNLDRPPLLSWGAILGGLVFVVAIFWLLNLLGMALGTSVADATDEVAISNGFTTAAIVWLVVSSLVAYFVGSLLAARLSGKIDSTAGMLHGMTLWGVATTLMIILSYWGVTGLAQTGYSLLSSATSAAASTVSSTASVIPSTDAIGQTLANAADSRLADNIKARLKRRASTVIARIESDGGVNVTPSEVRQAIDELDRETVEQIAGHLVAGEMTAAREELTAATNLSDREAREIVRGIENEFEEQLNTDENDTGLAGDIAISLNRQVADFVASLDAEGGADVSQSDVREALNQMDRETMQTVAMRLMHSDVQGAKDALAANTNLTPRQINDVVDGVHEDVSRTVKKYREQAEATVESASTYAQAVLWTVFVAGAMGLGVSLLGGWIGAESSRRIEVEVRRPVPTV